MIDAPFRVMPTSDPEWWRVVAPDGKEYTKSKCAAHADVAILNSAWVAANGPALTRQRDEAVELLRELEWKGAFGQEGEHIACPCCKGVQPDLSWDDYDREHYKAMYEDHPIGHTPDCRLAAALRRGEGK